MAFVNFKEARERQESYRDVEVPEWGGMVRLNRLNAGEVLDLVEMQEEFAKADDGSFSDQSEAIEFAVEFCARTIADESGTLQYDDLGGRDFLRLEFKSIQSLVTELTDLHQLNGNTEGNEDG